MLMWLQAYYTEADAKPIVDLDKMNSDGAKIAEYCGRYPTHTVIIAADNAMEK